jgi:hypothetical protein
MIKLINLLNEIENKEILSKDEIKKIAQYDLNFQSDEYSNESDNSNNITIKPTSIISDKNSDISTINLLPPTFASKVKNSLKN